MLQLLQATKPATDRNPLSFGAPVLNAFGEFSKLLGRSVTNPLTLVPPDPFLRSSPVSVPRVPIAPVTLPRVPFPQSHLVQPHLSTPVHYIPPYHGYHSS